MQKIGLKKIEILNKVPNESTSQLIALASDCK